MKRLDILWNYGNKFSESSIRELCLPGISWVNLESNLGVKGVGKIPLVFSSASSYVQRNEQIFSDGMMKWRYGRVRHAQWDLNRWWKGLGEGSRWRPRKCLWCKEWILEWNIVRNEKCANVLNSISERYIVEHHALNLYL